MGHRLVPALLLALLVVVHAQLWIGRGSVPKVSHLQSQLIEQDRLNQLALEVNNQLAADIHDLKAGLEMVEEKARTELGMVKSNEIYVQYSR